VADTDTNDIEGGHLVPGTVRTPAPEVDLDAIERDLAGVERALERLSDGTYWTDEVTGEPIPDEVLASDPTARRA
jgi:RNA polymerase-binding transcription factor DksA